MCDKQPAFNVSGEKKGRFCVEHKESGMVDVKNKKCELCEVIPHFNTRGEKKGRFCVEHREPGMVDVKNKTCAQDECNKQASYAFEGDQPLYCVAHCLIYLCQIISLFFEFFLFPIWSMVRNTGDGLRC